MFTETPNYELNSISEFAVKQVLREALKAVSESSYGVGGALVNLKNGAIIKTKHNTVIARESEGEQKRLKDPTAHGERQLVDWYFQNKKLMKLPEPEDILVVTSLDPCLMCTGSILSAGFKVAVVALDDNAGINWDSTYTFSALHGDVQKLAKESFIYPKDELDPSRPGYGVLPLFTDDILRGDITKHCFDTFLEGANQARAIVKAMIPAEQLYDLCKVQNDEVLQALRAQCPDALKYKTKTGKGTPDEGLAPFLIKAALEDYKYGGDGDAVAFLDIFGNLLMCCHGRKDISPIRSAFMETVRAYQQVRYELTKTCDLALHYLCDPSQGTFVFVKGFDQSAQSFADIGAYGSAMLNPPCAHNLQYLIPRMAPDELMKYIGGMPERYSKIIIPELASDERLRSLVRQGTVCPDVAERRIEINLPQGYWLTAYASMEAGNRITATLRGERTVYFSCTNNGSPAPQRAASDYIFNEDEHLRLELKVGGTAPQDIKIRENYECILDAHGKEIAKEYRVFVEDWTDEDYNDLYLSVTAWKKR